MMLRCALRQQVRFAQAATPCEYSLDVVGSEAHRKLAREQRKRRSFC